MTDRDWYPNSMDARGAWHQNFVDKLPGFAAKYNISAADQAQAAADNDWMQWAVGTRHSVNAFSQQVTKYFNDIAGNDPTKDKPEPLSFGLTAPPSEPAPGMEFRTREWARQMKGTTDYSEADGEAMGIVASETTPPNLAEMAPEFTLRTLANFELEATFRKLGTDALRFEFRYKGGNWQQAGFLVTSPGTFAVMPQTPGEAEQIEVRAFFIQKNNTVGNPSDAKTAFIAP